MAAFRQACGQPECARLIMTSPEVHALVHLASNAIGEQAAHIAGLRAELDRYQGRTVFFTTDAMLATAAGQLLSAARPGDMVRATDTGRELRCTATGEWEPV